MQKNVILSSDHYGQRILMRRTYLGKEASPEALMLLSEMLSIAPAQKKKEHISSLAAGEVTFRVENYGEGYLFFGMLSQASSRKLHFLFSDPYKAGRRWFENLYLQGFLESEELLSQAKDHLLSHRTSFASHNGFTFATPDFDARKVPSLTMNMLHDTLHAVLSSQKGSLIYLGPKSKDDPFLDLKSFEQPLPSLEKGYRRFDRLDHLLLAFEGKKLSNRKELLCRNAALRTVALALEAYYQNNFAPDLRSSLRLVDPTHSILSFDVIRGDSHFLQSKLPAIDSLSLDPFLEEALLETSLDAVRKASSVEILLSEVEMLLDFDILDPREDLFSVPALSAEEVKQEIRSLKVMDKEVSHD